MIQEETQTAGELESISDRYAHGDCGPFAVACTRAHKDRGWTLVIFTAGGFFQHAAAKVSDVLYFDAYGFCTLEDLRIRYGLDLVAEPATEEDIDDVTGVDDDEVEEADEHRVLLEELLIKCGRVVRGDNGDVTPADRDALIRALVWSGKGYRAYNYNPPGKSNVGDLIAYERDELGNTDVGILARRAASLLGVDLGGVPAADAIWVTKTRKQAEQYLSEDGKKSKDISEHDVNGWVRIVDLGDEGCLLVKPEHIPSLTVMQSAPARKKRSSKVRP